MRQRLAWGRADILPGPLSVRLAVQRGYGSDHDTAACQVGLNGLNFFTGAIQTAFGPFFTVYLTQQGWSQVDIGFALSVGTVAALVFQMPAGVLVDHIHYKRISIAIALVLIGISALVLVVAPNLHAVLAARVLHAFASCLLGPADRRAHADAVSGTTCSASGWASTAAMPHSAPPSPRPLLGGVALLSVDARRCSCSPPP